MIDILEPEPPCVGIDLGTTNSVVCVFEEGLPHVLSLKGQCLTPSKIGKFSSFKRHMSTPLIDLGEGRTPLTLSAELLSYLKRESEYVLGKEISQVVMSVPAYFDEEARKATKRAAHLAGLKVLRLLNEPTAAALAYGFSEKGIYAIYDLGGGTFDLSILKVDDGIFQVLATGGDLSLGGDDIDEAISIYFGCTREEARYKKETSTINPQILDALSRPWIQKTLDISARVIQDASLTLKDLDGVVLVGGATRLQGLQRDVARFFGQTPCQNLNPDDIVAMGAARHASTLMQKEKKALLLDVTPLSLGMETLGGKVDVFIPRNTPIPTRMVQEFTTFADNQTSIKFHIVQGENENVLDCRSLATFHLKDLPPLPAGVLRVQVSFFVDENGLLRVEALHDDKIHEIRIDPSSGLSKDTIGALLLPESSFFDQRKDS